MLVNEGMLPYCSVKNVVNIMISTNYNIVSNISSAILSDMYGSIELTHSLAFILTASLPSLSDFLRGVLIIGILRQSI